MTQKNDWTRRRFMTTAASAAGLAAMPRWSTVADEAWNAGRIEHLLPAACHDRIAIKATFAEAPEGPVFLKASDRRVAGRPTDSDGRFFAFDIGDLEANVEYTLQLVDAAGDALCDPWPLRTFPDPDARPEHVRLLTFTCAGGHPADTYWFLPLKIRRRLLRWKPNPGLHNPSRPGSAGRLASLCRAEMLFAQMSAGRSLAWPRPAPRRKRDPALFQMEWKNRRRR